MSSSTPDQSSAEFGVPVGHTDYGTPQGEDTRADSITGGVPASALAQEHAVREPMVGVEDERQE